LRQSRPTLRYPLTVPVTLVGSPGHPAIAGYADVGNPKELRRRGLFVAEGRLVVRRLLEGRRFRVASVLVSETARAALADVIDAQAGALDVFVAPPRVMSEIAGYNVHRGCLALAERPSAEPQMDGILRDRDLLVVLERVVDADNVGASFRNAAAFGAAVLLSPGCCDPFYRKAVRTSQAAVLTVPFATLEPWPAALGRLRQAGFAVAALTTSPQAVTLAGFVHDRPPRLALVLGTEGSGLTADAIGQANVLVRIPIDPAVDSLNVATAAAVAMARVRERGA